MDSYNDARIDLWDLRSGQRKTLITGGTSAVYSPSGHIIYARDGKLLAVPFDVNRLELTGSPFEVLDGVQMSGNTGAASFTLSKRGDLAYVPGTAEGGHRTLVWVDRSGHAEPLRLPQASYLYPHISPDGRYLAVETEGPNHDFSVYDFARSVLTKMTTDGLSHDPVWSPDGKRIAYRAWEANGMTMWSMPADRSAMPERLDPAGVRVSPVSFSPDGQFLAFDEKNADTQDDARVWSLKTNTAIPVATSRFQEGSAKFSPDGKWIAYASAESGQSEVYVQPFPGPGPKIQISSGGGFDPVWRRSGGELFYRNGNKMMVTTVSMAGGFRASAPRMLWEARYSSGRGSSCGMPGVASSNYDVSADGQRFLMVRDDDTASSKSIVVVLNWAEELRARAVTATR
jgi:eukaryotic-like serine/threonine-protein kinase